MQENKKSEKTGGLYANVKMPLKTANIMVAVGIAVLCVAFAAVISLGGFTVNFDSAGGTDVSPQRQMYGDIVSAPVPERYGYTFTGWYTDADRTELFDEKTDTVSGDIVLYAGWKASEDAQIYNAG